MCWIKKGLTQLLGKIIPENVYISHNNGLKQPIPFDTGLGQTIFRVQILF